MKYRRRKASTGEEKSLGSQLMGLSLFFMLLAFFIVMNAISTFEETKANPIMGSINYTFARGKVSSQIVQTVTEKEDIKSINEGDTLERMKALFSAQIPGSRSAINKTKGELYLRAPFDEFNAAVIAAGAGNTEGVRFLPAFIALMRNEAAGAPLRMDMVYSTRENPAALQNEAPQSLAAHMKDMSAIAVRLEAAGLQKKLMSAGVQEGDEGMVEIFFRRHIPFNPLGERHDDE